jgi:uncharacterized protein (DUF427 family)
VSSNEKLRIEPGAKRIRTYLAGELVADTTHPVLVWERPHYPAYYFPATDVRTDLFERDGEVAHLPGGGMGRLFTVNAGGKSAPRAALRVEESPNGALYGLFRFEWDAMDVWLEEDEEVFTHPRDLYTRLDILPSSRHVRVEIEGVTIAESTSSRLLFETGLPVRYYLPKPHVGMDLLVHTDTVTRCPYKGQAEYWSVRLGHDIFDDQGWSYPTPLPESQRIAGLIAFYNEKVDLYIDGVLDKRPRGNFS